MDYLSNKVTVLVGEASSKVNETRRKWQRQRGDDGKQTTKFEYIDNDEQTSGSRNNATPQALNTTARSHRITSTLAAGFPFGGDSMISTASPPPIGFRTDLLVQTTQQASSNQAHTSQVADRQPPAELDKRSQLGADSTESLYEGDAWGRLWFQRVMTLCLLRLLLFVRKVYEDFHATKVYNLTGQTGHLLAALATLFLPTIVFTIYRVARYLQMALPPLRQASGQQSTNERAGERSRAENDEAQLTRALMGSPVQSINNTESASATHVASLSSTAANSPPNNPEDNDGLVTARQTPTLDEFHDSQSQQDVDAPDVSQSPEPLKAPSRASRVSTQASPSQQPATSPSPLESVDVDRLMVSADAEDRNTTRVVLGASEQLLHGALFIFWQLKRQVDVLGYLVERACLWRKPAEREKEELDRLRIGADGLEWFQDFYAAFLAILAQVYTLGLHWSGDERSANRLSAAQVSSATSGLTGSDSGANELSISQSARAISNLLSSQAIGGNTLGGKDVLIMSELIVSTAVVVSLLIAVRRHDDGPLTLGLSMLGWGSLFTARIIIVALSFVHLGWNLMLSLVIVHVIIITGWVYYIALASHNDMPSERQDEAKWDEETAIELRHKKQRRADLTTQEEPSNTSRWSIMEHIVLLAQILTLFAIPSIFYWPIMFNLKLHFRPFKYLVLILIENFLLIPAIWLNISQASATPGQLYLLGTVGGFSILGFIFISLYISCKPSLTEFFARADELFNEAEKSGIYYEFCSRVFKMPDLSKQTFRRLMNQSEAIEEIVEDDNIDDK